MRNKRGMELSFLGWLLIAVAVLVLVLVFYFILTGKASGMIGYIKNLFRLRRLS